VITFPLEALDPVDPMAGLKRAKRISNHTAFFKAGICLGQVLVCIVKSSLLSSTIKTLEPIDQNEHGKNKPTFTKLLQGGNDTLRFFRVGSRLCRPTLVLILVGILRSRGVEFYTFSQDQVVCGMLQGFRDCGSGEPGYPGIARSSGQIARVCTEEG
jgi:hypothetical protein